MLTLSPKSEVEASAPKKSIGNSRAISQPQANQDWDTYRHRVQEAFRRHALPDDYLRPKSYHLKSHFTVLCQQPRHVPITIQVTSSPITVETIQTAIHVHGVPPVRDVNDENSPSILNESPRTVTTDDPVREVVAETGLAIRISKTPTSAKPTPWSPASTASSRFSAPGKTPERPESGFLRVTLETPKARSRVLDFEHSGCITPRPAETAKLSVAAVLSTKAQPCTPLSNSAIRGSARGSIRQSALLRLPPPPGTAWQRTQGYSRRRVSPYLRTRHHQHSAPNTPEVEELGSLGGTLGMSSGADMAAMYSDISGMVLSPLTALVEMDDPPSSHRGSVKPDDTHLKPPPNSLARSSSSGGKSTPSRTPYHLTTEPCVRRASISPKCYLEPQSRVDKSGSRTPGTSSNQSHSPKPSGTPEAPDRKSPKPSMFLRLLNRISSIRKPEPSSVSSKQHSRQPEASTSLSFPTLSVAALSGDEAESPDEDAETNARCTYAQLQSTRSVVRPSYLAPRNLSARTHKGGPPLPTHPSDAPHLRCAEIKESADDPQSYYNTLGDESCEVLQGSRDMAGIEESVGSSHGELTARLALERSEDGTLKDGFAVESIGNSVGPLSPMNPRDFAGLSLDVSGSHPVPKAFTPLAHPDPNSNQMLTKGFPPGRKRMMMLLQARDKPSQLQVDSTSNQEYCLLTGSYRQPDEVVDPQDLLLMTPSAMTTLKGRPTRFG